MNGTTIVGYLYGPDQGVFCPDCIRELLLPLDLVGSTQQSTEAVLDYLAWQRGLVEWRAGTRSARDFPVPIYLGEANDTDLCLWCGAHLETKSPPP
jgi:hypothetical protein